MKTLILSILLCPVLLLAQPSDRSSLKANIQGLEPLTGKVAIELSDASGNSLGDYWIAVEGDIVTLYLDDLEPGRYAIKFFHDENNNGEMDRNLIGIPTEAFGWSNDAEFKMKLPPIEELVFSVDGPTEITMNARTIF